MNKAIMQYNIVTNKIRAIYLKARGINPIIAPRKVKGTIMPANINIIEEKYTGLLALLCINGNFAVLIICRPTKLETML